MDYGQPESETGLIACGMLHHKSLVAAMDALIQLVASPEGVREHEDQGAS